MCTLAHGDRGNVSNMTLGVIALILLGIIMIAALIGMVRMRNGGASSGSEYKDMPTLEARQEILEQVSRSSRERQEPGEMPALGEVEASNETKLDAVNEVSASDPEPDVSTQEKMDVLQSLH
jgi:hypothetical protein